tara:strand:- start:240 stop:536 length:297 start_codon:yes stop_codon:yes gene_type:complete
MGIGRYTYASRINKGEGISNPRASSVIYKAVSAGLISVTNKKLIGKERLDVLASQQYGDPSYWWIIAAASGIGWGLQVPPGTILRIPNNLAQVLRIVR